MKTVREVALRVGLAAVLLVLIVSATRASASFAMRAPNHQVLGANLESRLAADYSADPKETRFAPLAPVIIEEIQKDNQIAGATAQRNDDPGGSKTEQQSRTKVSGTASEVFPPTATAPAPHSLAQTAPSNGGGGPEAERWEYQATPAPAAPRTRAATSSTRRRPPPVVGAGRGVGGGGLGADMPGRLYSF